MRTTLKAPFLVLTGAAVLFAGACSSDDSTSTPTSSPHAVTSHAATTSAATTTVTETDVETTTPTQPGVAPATTAQDDDPGGHPCKDQNGASGHYIYSDSSSMWVCEINEDAPRVTPTVPPAQHDDDPGGHPCKNQDGATGHFIWAESTNQWVCQIS